MVFRNKTRTEKETEKYLGSNHRENIEQLSSLEEMIRDSKKEDKETKELFSNKGIKTRTDLSDREISILSRLLFLCDKFRLQDLNTALHNFMELRVSKGRKSRKEFIEGMKSQQMNQLPFPMGNQGGGFFK